MNMDVSCVEISELLQHCMLFEDKLGQRLVESTTRLCVMFLMRAYGNMNRASSLKNACLKRMADCAAESRRKELNSFSFAAVDSSEYIVL